MKSTNTLKQNIEWLLEQYKKALREEEAKDIDNQNLATIWDYQNIIIELEYALNIKTIKKELEQ